MLLMTIFQNWDGDLIDLVLDLKYVPILCYNYLYNLNKLYLHYYF